MLQAGDPPDGASGGLGRRDHPRDQGNRIAYAMRVDESLTFEEYWSDPRFKAKRPARVVGAPIVERCGDNCYEPLGGGSFRQVRGLGHWDRDNDREHEGSKRTDLGGKRVLVGQRFCYYGTDAVPFPEHLTLPSASPDNPLWASTATTLTSCTGTNPPVISRLSTWRRQPLLSRGDCPNGRRAW